MIVDLPTTNAKKVEYYLSANKIEYTVDSGEYDISKAFGINCWIIPRLEHDYVLIKMKAKIKNRRQDDERRILQYVNYLNRNYLPNAYYHEDGTLFGEYYFLGTITNSRDQFIETLMFCTSIFKSAIIEDDRFNLISFG
jgi:hypothetical protein